MGYPTEPSVTPSSAIEKTNETASKPVPRSERILTINEAGRTAHGPEEINDMYYLSLPVYDRGGSRYYIKRLAGSNAKYAYQRPLDEYDAMTRKIFHPLTLAYQIGATFVDPEGKANAQKKATEAALEAVQNATMGITENFLDNLNDSHITIQSLNMFEKLLGEDGVNQDAKLGELDGMDLESNMQENEALKRAIAAITRYVEGYLFSHGVGEDYTRTEYMSDDPSVISREIETVGEIDIRFLREIIKTVLTLEIGRKNFWAVQLLGQPDDDEAGISRRFGVVDIHDDKVRKYLSESLGEIYRGVYKTPIEM